MSSDPPKQAGSPSMQPASKSTAAGSSRMATFQAAASSSHRSSSSSGTEGIAKATTAVNDKSDNEKDITLARTVTAVALPVVTILKLSPKTTRKSDNAASGTTTVALSNQGQPPIPRQQQANLKQPANNTLPRPKELPQPQPQALPSVSYNGKLLVTVNESTGEFTSDSEFESHNNAFAQTLNIYRPTFAAAAPDEQDLIVNHLFSCFAFTNQKSNTVDGDCLVWGQARAQEVIRRALSLESARPLPSTMATRSTPSRQRSQSLETINTTRKQATLGTAKSQIVDTMPADRKGIDSTTQPAKSTSIPNRSATRKPIVYCCRGRAGDKLPGHKAFHQAIVSARRAYETCTTDTQRDGVMSAVAQQFEFRVVTSSLDLRGITQVASAAPGRRAIGTRMALTNVRIKIRNAFKYMSQKSQSEGSVAAHEAEADDDDGADASLNSQDTVPVQQQQQPATKTATLRKAALLTNRDQSASNLAADAAMDVVEPMATTGETPRLVVHCGKGFQNCLGNAAYLEYIASIQDQFMLASDEAARNDVVELVLDRFDFYKHGRLIIGDEPFVQAKIRAALGNPRYGNNKKGSGGGTNSNGARHNTVPPKPIVYCRLGRADKLPGYELFHRAIVSAQRGYEQSSDVKREAIVSDIGKQFDFRLLVGKTTMSRISCGQLGRGDWNPLGEDAVRIKIHNAIKYLPARKHALVVTTDSSGTEQERLGDEGNCDDLEEESDEDASTGPCDDDDDDDDDEDDPDSNQKVPARGTNSNPIVHCGYGFRDLPGNMAYVECIALMQNQFLKSPVGPERNAIIATVRDQFDFVRHDEPADETFVHNKITYALHKPAYRKQLPHHQPQGASVASAAVSKPRRATAKPAPTKKLTVHCGSGLRFRDQPGNKAYSEYLSRMKDEYEEAVSQNDAARRNGIIDSVKQRFEFVYQDQRPDDAFLRNKIVCAFHHLTTSRCKKPSNVSHSQHGRNRRRTLREDSDDEKSDDSAHEADEDASTSTSACNDDDDDNDNHTQRPVVHCGQGFRDLPGNMAYVECIAVMHDRYKQASNGPERNAVISMVRNQFDFVSRDEPAAEAFVRSKISIALSSPGYLKHLPKGKEQGAVKAAAVSKPRRTVAKAAATTKKPLVYCGAGRSFRDQPGNIAYTEYIATRKDEYVMASLQGDADKRREVIDAVKDRFEFEFQGRRPDDVFLRNKIVNAFCYAKNTQPATTTRPVESPTLDTRQIQPKGRTTGKNKQQGEIADSTSRKKPRIDLDEIIVVS